MQKFIFGERNGIYIIDLQKTLKKFREAYAFVRDLAAGGGTVLFIGTKKQAQETVFEEASRCGMFYVNQRWLGGTLTNFTTIRRSITRLKKLEEMKETGAYERPPRAPSWRWRRRTTNHGRDRAAGEGAPRPDGRGCDGLQGGAAGDRGRSVGRRRVPEEEGVGAGGQAVTSGGARGRGRDVRPSRCQARGPRRGELRNRFRRADRGLPGSRQGSRHAGRGGEPRVRRPGGRPGRGGR